MTLEKVAAFPFLDDSIGDLAPFCQMVLVLVMCFAAAPASHAADAGQPIPVTPRAESVLTFDFPEMLVGVAEYDEGPTGTTVFYFPDAVKAAVDVRGGSPGTVNAAALMNGWDRKMMELVVFSGGSWYGLSATTGAANALKHLEAERSNPNFIAGAVGAIIYDVGGRRMTRITPDDRLGRVALENARPGQFPLGPHGAGRFAMQGVYFTEPLSASNSHRWPHSGQGGAFTQVGPTKIGVFTVVNSVGAIVDRNGRVVRCARNDPDRDCPSIREMLEVRVHDASEAPAGGPTTNTTLTLVVTNQKLPIAHLERLAKQVHGSMSRAIQPFATQHDGDVLYAVSTDQVDNPDLTPHDLAMIASELAWDAVLTSVPELPEQPVPLDVPLPPAELADFVGDFEFTDFARVAIREKDGVLVAWYGGIDQIYFDQPEHALLAADGDRFIIDLPARDVIRFERTGGEVSSLTLNPGPWAISARRVPIDADSRQQNQDTHDSVSQIGEKREPGPVYP
ncbi:peptidase S58 DmpA [Wenzhouxiangella sp. XN201]|uniref:P1 family peptidase n=1 Tax=Wenzhouxiangella sp. XN201 TaxID=2710755 RepID=UPI0013CC8E4C|nr:P1 family peptidase [Wenzhouxiangella sp. XN201]NEZ03081.1 peptidase S58 DmpA [Wenzhouxiangella sp. XN201]